jgi:hypothetical protein
MELVSPFGGQIITSQFRCPACNTYFEAVREEFAEASREAQAVREEFAEASTEAQTVRE